MTRLVLTAILALAPLTATAQAGCTQSHAAMSCPQGQVWSETSNSCVNQTS